MKKAGISLVALVITIIVLIILTGAVIVTFMEGGIIDRAKESTFKSDIRTYQEQLAIIRADEQIAISTKDEDYNGLEVIGKTIEEGNEKSILPEFKEEYEGIVKIDDGKLVLVNPIPENEAERTKEEQWLIDLGIGLAEETEEGDQYDTGVEVTIGTEKFRVLKDNGSTLTLLTEKCITTDTYVQSSSAQGIVFSSTNYWSSETEYPLNLNEYTSESIVATDAIEVAKAYASKIAEDTGFAVTGRLMTVEEVVELDGSMDEYSTSACPTWINQDDEGNGLFYWLATNLGGSGVWRVNGVDVHLNPHGIYNDSACVRPVITISKDALK